MAKKTAKKTKKAAPKPASREQLIEQIAERDEELLVLRGELETTKDELAVANRELQWYAERRKQGGKIR